MKQTPSNFSKFYAQYCKEHSHPQNFAVHHAGLLGWAFLVVLGVILKSWLFVLLGFLVCYGCSWFGHLYYQKNKPTTWKHPIWSVLAFCRLFILGDPKCP